MNYMKRRISLLLCMLMVFTTIFTAAPVETQAANTTHSLYSQIGMGTNSKVIVYKGVKDFYIGDLITATKITNPNTPQAEYTSLGNLSQLSGVSYKSSKTSVASISKKGLITAKKAGTAKITVKYKGQSIKYELKVVAKKDFDKKLSSYGYGLGTSVIDEDAKAFLKKTGTNPTIKTSNRYKLLDAYNNYQSSGGCTSMPYIDSATGVYTIDYYIFSPSAIRANVVCNKISSYCNKYNPFVTTSSKCFKIKSISGKSNKITVTLKSKVTADQIFGAQAQFNWDSEIKKIKKGKPYTFPIVVRNTSNGYKYYATASIKEGSKTMTITLKNAKLTKGKTYELLAQTSTSRNTRYLGTWLDGSINKYKFKAK